MQHDMVKDYYGKILQKSEDLKTDACCTTERPSDAHMKLLNNIHEEVRNRYYGCGLIAPEALEGARVLDLGCGTGHDVYALAQMVGENGFVAGVDMTSEQLDVAKEYEGWHTDRFGYKQSNVAFHQGYIEKLDELPLDPGSFDVVVSNCVINLSPDKPAVLEGVKKLLKPGGEFYFSDVYADRRIPEALGKDPVIYGECLGGALYWNDFLTLSKNAGFGDPRLVTSRPMEIGDAVLEEKLEGFNFYSATYRLFNIDSLEPACEDYGQAVIYNGGVAGAETAFTLDNHHVIEKGRVFPVCGNTYLMLKDSRFASYFTFIGDFSKHYGIFPGCGVDSPFVEVASGETSGDCC